MIINVKHFVPNNSISFLLESLYLGKEKQKKIKAFVNKKEESKDYILKENDSLYFIFDEKLETTPWDKKLDILYEDDYLLLVNKESGILVHSDGVNDSQTLDNIVANYYLKKGYDFSVKHVHRIDKDTTGIVIYAKDILTQSYLNHLIENNQLHRDYLLLCSGRFDEVKGTYNYPIAEDRHQANKKRVSITGKVAITDYEIVDELSHNLNLVKAKLKTGRTHQIRLHFSYSGHPLLGDILYNGNCNFASRTMLHSYEVSFVSPLNNTNISVKCDLPFDMLKIINKNQKKKD